MNQAVFTKRLSALVPVDETGREILTRIKSGAEVMVEVKTARNPKFHRMFFALLNLLVDNSDSFSSVESALVALKYATHEVDTIVDASTGEVFYAPRSISFASMDQTRFRDLFDRSVEVITKRWLIGTQADDLRQRVYEIVDGRSAIGRRVA